MVLHTRGNQGIHWSSHRSNRQSKSLDRGGHLRKHATLLDNDGWYGNVLVLSMPSDPVSTHVDHLV